jgi:hypothetical protein
VIGCVAYQSGLAPFWLGVGLTGAAMMYLLQGLVADRWDTVVADGGLNWPSLVRSTWETVIAVSLCIGLIVFFREVVHWPNRLSVAMAAASYAAYILHLLIVIGLQAGIEGIAMPPVVKFALVASVGTILAFGVGHLSRYVPGLRTILGTTAQRVGQVEGAGRTEVARLPAPRRPGLSRVGDLACTWTPRCFARSPISRCCGPLSCLQADFGEVLAPSVPSTGPARATTSSKLATSQDRSSTPLPTFASRLKPTVMFDTMMME